MLCGFFSLALGCVIVILCVCVCVCVEKHLTEPQSADKNLNPFLVSQLSWHSGSHHFLSLPHEVSWWNWSKVKPIHPQTVPYCTHQHIELPLHLRSAI